MYNGRIYAGMLDGTLVALDQETGKPVWRTKVTEKADTVLTSPVRIVKGKVIVGSSGADNASRGFFAAYDADTGKQVWRFYTVPGDPSKGFEHPELEMAAKTWTGEWWKTGGGGGTVWDGMAYDEVADILYVGTGNGGPWNAAVRSPQGGDNLFLSSIIAVKPDTGKMVWYFQETPGETWDFTAVQNIILADLRIGGKDRKVLLHAPKNGFFYVLDRITGRVHLGREIRTAHDVGHRSGCKGPPHRGQRRALEGLRGYDVPGSLRRPQLATDVFQSVNEARIHSGPGTQLEL